MDGKRPRIYHGTPPFLPSGTQSDIPTADLNLGTPLP
mgnify:CR=1 FL=1